MQTTYLSTLLTVMKFLLAGVGKNGIHLKPQPKLNTRKYNDAYQEYEVSSVRSTLSKENKNFDHH